MKRRPVSICLIVLLSLASLHAAAQKNTRGIVVDSISLKALPRVYVRIKNTNRVAVTNATGVFQLTTTIADTLILTMVGYNTIELPLLFEEEDMMIRMGERFQLLNEVTITGNRLIESDIIRTERRQPHKMSTADAFSSPWEYFTKGQKEKRKVVKLINENDRIKTYIQVINDQEIREDIMYDHELTETEFYNTLALFNAQDRFILYETDPFLIVAALKSFFDRAHGN
ncbi:MAG: carboxypeptidase-like regulatory domain-containing protein [Chryseolinea sp.]